MQRPLPKSLGILAPFVALFLALPVLCIAWTPEPRLMSPEFDEQPKLSEPVRNSGGGPFQNSPSTAMNLPVPSQAPPAVSKSLYPPNVARDSSASDTQKTGLANFLSFLIPTKEDLEKCFKDENDSFRDRGRSASDPFRKRDWK